MPSPATNNKNNNNTVPKKFRQLHDTFIKCYNNQSPHFFVRAPGRVNLIGEHIDYEGYGVLPMALSQEVVLAVAIDESHADRCQVRVARDNAKFPPASFPTDPNVAMIDRDKSSSDWARYVRSGYKGTFLLWDDDEDAVGSGGVPMNILVDGNIPIAKGLSSSSALVVASIIATAKARGVNSSSSSSSSKITTDLPSSRHHLADIARRAEQFVGTMSGGMDQTISCLGQVQYVQFDPLRTEAVSLPPGVKIVVADSLTVEEKAVTADKRYNKRVVECALAAKYLAKELGLESWRGAMTLREVQESYGEMTKKCVTLKDMVMAVESHLPREGCTCETIVEMMGISPVDDGDVVDAIMSQLFETIEPSKRVMIERVVSKSNDFELYRRAAHVYAEAQRVCEFKELCNNSNNDTVIELGRLMNDSHDSCRDMYDCSSLKLDQLVGVCRNGGALGSRLTGAGWGGSVVSLVREEMVDGFVEGLKREFYGNEAYVDPSAVVGGIDDVVFVCQPSDGASIIVDIE